MFSINKMLIVTFDISSFNHILEERFQDKIIVNFFTKLMEIFENTTKRYNGRLNNYIENFIVAIFDIPDFNEGEELNVILYVKDINKNIKRILQELNKEYNVDVGIKSIVGYYNIIKEKDVFYKVIEDEIKEIAFLFNICNNYEILVNEEIYNNLKNIFLFDKIKDNRFYKIIEDQGLKIESNRTDSLNKEDINILTSLISKNKEKVLAIEGSNFIGNSSLINSLSKLDSSSIYIKVNLFTNSYYFSILKYIYDYIFELICSFYSSFFKKKSKFYNELFKIYISFNNYDKMSRISKYALFNLFQNLFRRISKIKKIFLIIGNYQYLDHGFYEFINFLIKALIKENVYFVLLTNNMNSLKNTNNFKMIKINIPQFSNEVIFRKIENLSDTQEKILKVIAIYGENIDLYFLKKIIGNIDIEKDIYELYNLNLLDIQRERNIFFTNNIISELVLKTILSKEEKDLHGIIANMLRKFCPKIFYEKIGFHYEKANDIKNAILYYFFAFLKARDLMDYRLACEFLDKSISLATLLYENNKESLFFEEDIEVKNYSILTPFWSYKIKFKLTIGALYYFRLNLTFSYESIYESLIEKLIVFSEYDFKISNYYIYFLSQIAYFNYLLFNKFRLDLSILSKIEKDIKEKKDELLLAIFYSSYILILISKNFSIESNEETILTNFFLARKIVIKSKNIDYFTKNSFLLYWYDNYIAYLKIVNKRVGYILNKIKKATKYCLTDFQKMHFYLKISGLLSPLSNEEYRQIYVKKALIYSKKCFSYTDVMHCYSNLCYWYLVKGRYFSALKMNKKAKFLSFLLNDKLEMSMIYKNLGDLYNCLKEYKKAEIAYKNSLKYKEEFDSTKNIIDFNNIVFPKASLCYSLIKNKKFNDAKDLVINIESNMSKIFFGNEIPIFINFIKNLLIIKDKYSEESIKNIKQCYFDIKNINPNAIQLIWIKEELKEYGVIL